MVGHDPYVPGTRMSDERISKMGRNGWEGYERELHAEVVALKAELKAAQEALASAASTGGETARSLLEELRLPDIGPSIAGSNPFDVTITVDLARRIRAVLRAAERKDKTR